MTQALAQAEVRSKVARERLARTMATLTVRLSPRALAQNALQSLVAKGQTVAQDGLDTARRNPLKLAGAVTAIGLLLARRSLTRLLKSEEGDATPPPPASSSTKRPRPATRKSS